MLGAQRRARRRPALRRDRLEAVVGPARPAGVRQRRVRRRRPAALARHPGQALARHDLAAAFGPAARRPACAPASGTTRAPSATPSARSDHSDITWHGDRAAHFVANSMSQGAVLIDADRRRQAALPGGVSMAYQSKNLSALGYANGFTLWHYRTDDLAAEVDNAGYFNAGRAGWSASATSSCSMPASARTPTHGVVVVVANAGGDRRRDQRHHLRRGQHRLSRSAAAGPSRPGGGPSPGIRTMSLDAHLAPRPAARPVRRHQPDRHAAGSPARP